MNTDEDWMRHALTLAETGENHGEVPVGAVIVKAGELVGEGWNRPITTHDPTAHAEIVALREAGKRLQNYRLVDTILYVTLEPCAMCMAAIAHARVGRLVYGALDPKRGAAVSAIDLCRAPFLNHQVAADGGVLAESCGALLNRFFASKRG